MNTKLFELKPCPQCKGTGDAHHQGHDYDCPDCLGTSYEEPAKRIINLESELTAARAKLTDTLTAMAMLGDKHEEEMDAARAEIERLRDHCRIKVKALIQQTSDRMIAEQQRDRLAEATTKLVHYIKQARAGDSPIIQVQLVEWIDQSITKVEAALQSLTTNVQAMASAAEQPTD
jgi:hypothetical protein